MTFIFYSHPINSGSSIVPGTEQILGKYLLSAWINLVPMSFQVKLSGS